MVHFCVTPDTRIMTVDGKELPIRALQHKEGKIKVLSFSPERNMIRASLITNYSSFKSKDFEAYSLEVESRYRITATGNQLFYAERGWVPMRALYTGEGVAIYLFRLRRIIPESGVSLKKTPFAWGRITKKSPIQGVRDVRDLVVEPDHTFIANRFVTQSTHV